MDSLSPQLLIIGFALPAAALTLYTLSQRASRQQAWLSALAGSGMAGLVGGAFIGDFHSHGFDIPWFIHGALIFTISTLLSCALMIFWPTKKP